MPPTHSTAHRMCSASSQDHKAHSVISLQFVEQGTQLGRGAGARGGLGHAQPGGEGGGEAGAVADRRAQQRQVARGVGRPSPSRRRRAAGGTRFSTTRALRLLGGGERQRALGRPDVGRAGLHRDQHQVGAADRQPGVGVDLRRASRSAPRHGCASAGPARRPARQPDTSENVSFDACGVARARMACQRVRLCCGSMSSKATRRGWRQRRREVGRQRGLAGAALLLRHRDDDRHGCNSAAACAIEDQNRDAEARGQMRIGPAHASAAPTQRNPRPHRNVADRRVTRDMTGARQAWDYALRKVATHAPPAQPRLTAAHPSPQPTPHRTRALPRRIPTLYAAATRTSRRPRPMTTPLAGITVLDFGQIYQGPYATLLMAKAGADVIKIEPPGGEPLRRRVLATGKGDTTLPIAMLNANKRAITLNLKSRARPRPAVPHGRARRRAAGEFFPRHDGRAGRRLRRAAQGQPEAGLCHRHRLRHHRPGSRQPGDGLHHPGGVRDHERHRRAGRAADEGRPDAGGFHGRHPSLRGGRHRAVSTRPHRRGPACRSGDAGGGVFLARRQLRLSSSHRQRAAARRQPPGRPVQRAVQHVPHHRRLGRDPCRHRGPLDTTC